MSYAVKERPVYSLVSATFTRLCEPDRPIIHSDQEWHYQMNAYQKTLQAHGIQQSMSRKGNCLDNADMKNFFGLLKYELLYLKEFQNRNYFKQELERYIHYYNNKWIKAKLKGMSPVQYRIHAQAVA